MLNISKPLSSGQAQTYHKLEFTSETANYYKQDGAVQGEWQGQLAARMGLTGTVTAEEFARLTEGRHPQTDEPMVKHREAQEYKNADGSTTKAVEHRAGWDATFSAPKSVSLTALVGGDERVREAHRAAVTAALTELERYTQARIGGNYPAETTGQFIAAKFEHDTARPVDGYAAPQLHTHAVIFNVTERADGSTRALQPQSFFESQNFATAVYQSALTHQLRNLGYEIEPGKSGAPEIKGYSQAYLDASSPRSQQIKDHLERTGHSGAEAAQIAAHATRDSKQILSPEQVLAAHKEIAESFGNQAATVVAEARERARNRLQNGESQSGEAGRETIKAREAVAYARSSNFEREAVVDERALMRDALRHGMGETTYAQIRTEFNSRRERGDFLRIEGRKYDSGRKFSTPETIAGERANVAHVMRGQGLVAPMMEEEQAAAQAFRRGFLNSAQRTVIAEVLTSTDRIHGLQGLAGTGKTTVLSSIREGAESAGYAVEGFAPTSRAAAQLREAGISATTLQSFLARGAQGQVAGDPANRHLYLLDESSLASTRQMRAFLDKIQPQDRVLVIGDTRQHQGVDAGRPFEQMQEAGMRTSRLDQIVRQKDPELLQAVEHLATGRTVEGVRLLGQQGRITEVRDANDRILAIARDYVAKPDNTIVVSPDNRSRQAINEAIRTELRATGALAKDDREYRTLTHRSDMTGADREWAARYRPGDILRYTNGSKLEGIERDSYAMVRSVDPRANTLTVDLENSSSLTYDPRRLRGVNVYRETTRQFATGDRLQFTAPNKELGVANRDLGTVVSLEDGKIAVRLDGKEQRTVAFDPNQHPQFDHGYAVTSHSSQGLTAGRVIANIDTDAARSLINTRLAYVAISRASEDASIYTNDAEILETRLATEISKTAAVDFRQPRSEVQRAAPQPPPIYQYSDPNHRLAAVALAYAERPDSTVAVAPEAAERRELNQLIRSELQAQGRVAPDSSALVIHVEKHLSDPKVATQYAPGDLIQYRQGSPGVDGIAHNSIATVLSVDARNNMLTVQTPSGDEATYNPQLAKTMTAESTVFRQEQREIAQGDRVQFTRADAALGIRKWDLGTVASIGASNLDVQLDKGSVVQLTAEQARHLDHGYAVESLKAGAPERVLFTQDAALEEREIASLARNGRDLNLYTSDGPVAQKSETQSQAVQTQAIQSPVAPLSPQFDAPAVALAPPPAQPAMRIRMGR
jgi:conjugative relaxase-like TrwC/TraI family protein